MFMNTMAVGPLEPAVLCVTGGATVALPLLHNDEVHGDKDVTRLAACAMGVRIAIATTKVGFGNGERDRQREEGVVVGGILHTQYMYYEYVICNKLTVMYGTDRIAAT